MLGRLSHFIQYNNAIPIFLGVIFLGSGAAFAASPEARDMIVSSEEIVRSIDNTRIVTINLNTFSVAVEIKGVTEDEFFYYIAYVLHTVDLVDDIWSDVHREKILEVSKDAIVGKDLGTYATKELAQVRDGEWQRLKETQKIEKERGISTKVVATVYGGLVGKFLDEKEEKIPGYRPVVDEKPAAPYAGTVLANPTPNPTTDSVAAAANNNTSTNTNTDGTLVTGDPTDTEAPVISILGNNPANVVLKSQYSDLGAYVNDNKLGALGYKIFVDGKEVASVQLNTSTTTTYTITYKAVDGVGNTSQATRTVNVYDPAATTTSADSGKQTANSTTSTTTTPANSLEPMATSTTPTTNAATTTGTTATSSESEADSTTNATTTPPADSLEPVATDESEQPTVDNGQSTATTTVTE